VEMHGVRLGIRFQALEQLEVRAENVAVVRILQGVIEEGGIFVMRAAQDVFVLL